MSAGGFWFKISLFLLVFPIACSPKSYGPRRDKIQAGWLLDLGRSALTKNQPREAFRELLSAQKYDPDNPLIYLELSHCARSLKKPALAADFLIAGIKYKPVSPDFYYYLGDIYTELENWPQAANYSLLAMENNSKFRLKSLYNLGRAYLEMGYFDPAQNTFEYLLTEGPGSFEARWQLQLCLERSGKWAEAVKNARKILKEYESIDQEQLRQAKSHLETALCQIVP